MRITIETVILVEKNASLQYEKNKFSEKLKSKSKLIEKKKQVQICTLAEENIATFTRNTAGQ